MIATKTLHSNWIPCPFSM
uniref:Uncharacterized protein n=1 Tax=Anguilla anguilla TaxID=7936 RepID=A0A0E9S4G8_ANGAN